MELGVHRVPRLLDEDVDDLLELRGAVRVGNGLPQGAVGVGHRKLERSSGHHAAHADADQLLGQACGEFANAHKGATARTLAVVERQAVEVRPVFGRKGFEPVERILFQGTKILLAGEATSACGTPGVARLNANGTVVYSRVIGESGTSSSHATSRS